MTVWNHIEPIAAEDGSTTTDQKLAVSLAISAKRQADALEKLVEMFSGPTNAWGETFTEAIGGNIERALRTANENLWQTLQRSK